MTAAVYGAPSPELVDTVPGALQVSPLVPGAPTLDTLADGSLDGIVIAAPPGAVERRFVLAQALRTLKSEAPLTVLAPNKLGGQRLRAELEAFGCEAVDEASRRHQRICHARRPDAPVGLAETIAAGGPQLAPQLGLWSQPGVFSWDRPDPGSIRLAGFLSGLYGEGADLGCGVGYLAQTVLAAAKVRRLTLVDIDGRAVQAARRNITDPRATCLHADVRTLELSGLDFVVMNPPFHEDGAEDSDLGRTFIRRAAASLRRGGVCRMVANIGLAYDAVLAERFREVVRLDQGGGYKVYEAKK
ncbi:MAG TPA: methyltransferase [Caulobacteraceae bacterium]